MRWLGRRRMYHPYFRGKQYELITIREMALVFKASKFCPIIEPVKESLNGLQKALEAVVRADANAVVVINPEHGDHSGAGAALTQLLKDKFLNLSNISAGILLKQDTTVREALTLYREHEAHRPVFVHAGFADPRALLAGLGKQTEEDRHIFFEDHCVTLYRRHFREAHRVLLRDGFKKKKNREYDLIENFSDLHITYKDEGMQGFGDFLIVGDEYSETGGPAYAVAIHLTFIDHDQEDIMRIFHFKSQRQDTPLDPAGKFAEALQEMMLHIGKPNSKVLETEAVKEFRMLHERGHFPGLGYVKKLSMNHHIDTLADYFKTAAA
jgi:hypothetical protein